MSSRTVQVKRASKRNKKRESKQEPEGGFLKNTLVPVWRGSSVGVCDPLPQGYTACNSLILSMATALVSLACSGTADWSKEHVLVT